MRVFECACFDRWAQSCSIGPTLTRACCTRSSQLLLQAQVSGAEPEAGANQPAQAPAPVQNTTSIGNPNLTMARIGTNTTARPCIVSSRMQVLMQINAAEGSKHTAINKMQDRKFFAAASLTCRKRMRLI